MHGPSHGGGSSFGGGGSGGGFSSGASFNASSGGGGFHGPRTFFFFGRPLVFTNGLFSGLIFLAVAIFLAGFFLVTCSIGLINNTRTVKNMEEDSIEWVQLIAKAKAGVDGYYLHTVDDLHFTASSGVFIDNWDYYGYSSYNDDTEDWVVANYMCTNDDTEYFQLYFIFTDERDEEIYGLTYGQYKTNQIMHLESVTFAYGDIDGELWAINADYDLEKCGDYLDAKDACKSEKIAITISAVVVAVLIGAVALIIVSAVKRARKNESLKEAEAQAEIEKTKAETDLTKAELKKKNRVCAYCGGAIPDDATFCPGCGARQIKDNEK